MRRGQPGPLAPSPRLPRRCACRTSRSLLGGLAAKLIVVEDGATFLRCKLSLYPTNPTHPQSRNAIYDLADLFGRVFWPQLICFRHGTPSVCPDASQCQAALLGSGRLVKIAHPGIWLRQNVARQKVAWQKVAIARIAPARCSRRAFAPRRSVFHRDSVRRLFRNPRHQTAADHKRYQDGKKGSQFQIVHHAFLRVGEGRHSQGRGDSHPLCIDNAVIDAAVPRAAGT